jgi:hypothetical protein
MDTTTLTEALRNLNPESITWSFALYSVSKGRDGIELEWHLCNMHSINEQVSMIQEYLLKKPVADKPVARYSPFLSDKENISALENDNEMIHSQLTDIFMNIRTGAVYPPQDFASGKLPNIAGYAFYGEQSESRETNERILFMRRGNPFLTRAPLFMGTENEIVPNSIPIIKFGTGADFISLSGSCYIFSSSIENDLAFENRYFAIGEKCLEKLAEVEIMGNYDSFENTVMKIKNAKKFLTFNEEILEYIIGLPITERIDYLGKYGVELDQAGKMESYESSASEMIIDLLCGRSCLDPLNRLSVGSNITPRE